MGSCTVDPLLDESFPIGISTESEFGPLDLWTPTKDFELDLDTLSMDLEGLYDAQSGQNEGWLGKFLVSHQFYRRSIVWLRLQKVQL